MRTLIVATTNRGKIGEFRALLDGVDFVVRGIGEVAPSAPPVVEDGHTFAENALKKARAAARLAGCPALADDSGLEVDVLGGRPGVRSARFARDGATDEENNRALLDALTRCGRPAPYAARFRCALAFVDPELAPGLAAVERVVEGVCEGVVVDAPRGHVGFGYDPLFVATGGGRTMAELSSEEKNLISHRARAVAALRPVLVEASRLSDRASRREPHSR